MMTIRMIMITRRIIIEQKKAGLVNTSTAFSLLIDSIDISVVRPSFHILRKTFR